MEVNIKVLGVEEIQKTLNKFNNEADRLLALKMNIVVKKLEVDAKGFAPFDTGFLMRHITSSVARKRSAVIGRVRSGAPYGIFQEFGTVHHPPQPFMRPSFIRNQGFIEEQLKEALVTAMFNVAVTRGTFTGRAL